MRGCDRSGLTLETRRAGLDLERYILERAKQRAGPLATGIQVGTTDGHRGPM